MSIEVSASTQSVSPIHVRAHIRMYTYVKQQPETETGVRCPSAPTPSCAPTSSPHTHTNHQGDPLTPNSSYPNICMCRTDSAYLDFHIVKGSEYCPCTVRTYLQCFMVHAIIHTSTRYCQATGGKGEARSLSSIAPSDRIPIL
jgi:hypothetical protein